MLTVSHLYLVLIKQSLFLHYLIPLDGKFEDRKIDSDFSGFSFIN